MIATVAEVGPSSAGNADKVEAPMLEEALVLCGDDGVHEDGRNVFVADGTALFAGAIEQIGNELRLDFGGAHLGTATEGTNRTDGLAGELYGQSIRGTEVGELGGANVDAVGLDGV